MTVPADWIAWPWRPHGGHLVKTRRDEITGEVEQISGLLHEAARLIIVFSGSWTEPTMTGPPGTRTGSSTLPGLPDLLGVRPVRSELIYLLVSLNKQ